MTANNDELKVQLLPCPWCGNPPISHWVGNEDGGYYEVACDSCNPKGPGAIAYMFCGVHGDDEDSCVERWNARQAAITHASSEAKGGEAVAYCCPHDPFNTTAFAWPGTERNEKHHTMPLYTSPRAMAEDVRDAERYRWLRDRSSGQWEHPIVVFQQHTDSGSRYVGPIPGKYLDRSIDQAIAGKRGDESAS